MKHFQTHLMFSLKAVDSKVPSMAIFKVFLMKKRQNGECNLRKFRHFLFGCLFVFFFCFFCFYLFVCFFVFVLFLFCFVLFCFVLFCFVLFCFVLVCFVFVFGFVLFCFVLFCFFGMISDVPTFKVHVFPSDFELGIRVNEN